MENLKYRSRISIFLSLLIALAFTPSIQSISENGIHIITIIAVSFAPILVISIFYSTKYIIKDDKLIVKCLGLKMANIHIPNIRSIKRSYAPFSSPAISLRRLCISYQSKNNRRSILISPVREQEFIEQLKAINPNITAENISDKTNILRFWDWDI